MSSPASDAVCAALPRQLAAATGRSLMDFLHLYVGCVSFHGIRDVLLISSNASRTYAALQFHPATEGSIAMRRRISATSPTPMPAASAATRSSAIRTGQSTESRF